MKIEIGRVGRVLQGDDAGWYVRVLDESARSGGFIILSSPTPDMTGGFDNWVPDLPALEGFFGEARWLVEWL